MTSVRPALFLPSLPAFLLVCRRSCGPVIGKYSQHPDSGEPAERTCGTVLSILLHLQGVFTKTHRPVVSLSSLSPPPFTPRVAAEVGRRLDTTLSHLSSLPLAPLESRAARPPPALCPACMLPSPLPLARGQHSPAASTVTQGLGDRPGLGHTALGALGARLTTLPGEAAVPACERHEPATLGLWDGIASARTRRCCALVPGLTEPVPPGLPARPCGELGCAPDVGPQHLAVPA